MGLFHSAAIMGISWILLCCKWVWYFAAEQALMFSSSAFLPILFPLCVELQAKTILFYLYGISYFSVGVYQVSNDLCL
jgi:hypothetical protein